jgi:hypothetical protein
MQQRNAKLILPVPKRGSLVEAVSSASALQKIQLQQSNPQD